MAENREVFFEDARIKFRNFEGRPGPFNQKGDRSFAIVLDDETAQQLSREGWNVKFPEQRVDSDFAPEPYLSVSVRFDPVPPTVVLITGENHTVLTENDIYMLDHADIRMLDIVITPYDWELNGRTGRKAYLKKIYVTVATDRFTQKYGI